MIRCLTGSFIDGRADSPIGRIAYAFIHLSLMDSFIGAPTDSSTRRLIRPPIDPVDGRLVDFLVDFG